MPPSRSAPEGFSFLHTGGWGGIGTRNTPKTPTENTQGDNERRRSECGDHTHVETELEGDRPRHRRWSAGGVLHAGCESLNL